MASGIIHMAIAKKINEKLKRNEKDLLLGSIAPDLNTFLNICKNESHFYDNNTDRSGLDKFLKKYPNYYKNDYETGYYIHLCTDYLWFNKFLPTFRDYENRHTFLLNNKVEIINDEDFGKLYYEDYENLNIPVIDYYSLDLSLFYDELVYPTTDIEEVDISKIQVLLDKMGLIVKNDKGKNNYNIMNLDMIISFVDDCVKEILEELNDNIYQ